MAGLIGIAVLLTLILFSIISYWKKALDVNGILLANIVGVVAFYFGGITSFLLMVLFFLVAEFSTRYARLAGKNGKTHRTRTTGNVLGNSGAALMALVLNPVALNPAFFGAISAALSDTISGEIGLLSRKNPRLITSMAEVEPGVDGGVTLLGLAAGVVAALLIALIYFALTGNPLGILYITVAGFAGSLMDSLLGATLERKGILNNTSVNFIASGTGAIAAWLLFSFL